MFSEPVVGDRFFGREEVLELLLAVASNSEAAAHFRTVVCKDADQEITTVLHGAGHFACVCHAMFFVGEEMEYSAVVPKIEGTGREFIITSPGSHLGTVRLP